MTRFRIEREFPDSLAIPINAEGRKALNGVITTNADFGVIWMNG